MPNSVSRPTLTGRRFIQFSGMAAGDEVVITIHNGALYISNDGGGGRIRYVDLLTNIIQTYVGSTPGYDGDGHLLTNSQLDRPSMVIFNAAGNIVFADTLNGRVREGLTHLSTLAGGYVGDRDTPTSAAFIQPEAVNFDVRGNYYIADAAANRVRKVNAASGRISTVAGTGIAGYSGDGRQANEAKLSYPSGVAADSNGNIFISDSFNAVIRKVSACIAGRAARIFASCVLCVLGATDSNFTSTGKSQEWRRSPVVAFLSLPNGK